MVRSWFDGNLWDWPEYLDFYGWVDLDFEVLDRKGYRAKWLEEKLTDDDVSRIHDEIVGVMQ